ncbi:hypothetical protein SDRG_10515 [Saprolegnia diclina VS20]|uniref:DAGKc domain-containing protein n=1 Tax=Saprolegnia diclina (strain VS20) TaxID=1156394 RepID=T0RHD3_SAPDV|nr:hypothetical protein SDRG_10515 [Saprolegnia diclina VS20]EQC31723.1 hypothetical protein SDRG_10515 [Saprolegnia diclina VS20]|eukprot:XP_008614730.1 hypothetical protein SDRG_10515 [Saprolegnia diclina VS20]
MISTTAFVFARHDATVSAARDTLTIAVAKKPKMDEAFAWADVLGASAFARDTTTGLVIHVFAKHKNGKRKLREVELTASGSSQQDIDKWLCVIRYFACPTRHADEPLATLDVIVQAAPKQRRFLALVNPVGGSGKGEKIYEKVAPLFMHANIHLEKLVTERFEQAIEIAAELDLAAYDGVVLVGGDGAPYEVIQGFMRRQDWAKAIKFPFGIIPAGSGNGLAGTMAHAAGERCNPETSAFMVIKGRPLPLDIASLRNEASTTYIFLSLSWAFMAEVDFDSEKYRYLGGQRFAVSAIAKIFTNKGWTGKFSYAPATPEDVPMYWDTDATPGDAPRLSLLPAIGDPLPSDWTSTEGVFSLFWAMNVTHAGQDAHVAPMADLCDGHMHVVLMEGSASLGDYASVMLNIDNGEHVQKPCVKVVTTRAFQLETPDHDVLSADGERYGGGVCQVEVHRGLARVLGFLA